MNELAIQFESVSFSYPGQEDVKAVNHISFSVERGEFLAILGHNGSGKSTLARLVNGLLQADEGTITVFGYDVSLHENIPEVRKKAGIVFQNPDNQMVASIVEDDVAFGPENIGIERAEIGRRIDWALEAVGMSDYKSATPTRLSGGQKQRIAIAGVLAIKPDILILDESTAMLDPKGRAEVINVVKKLNQEEGMTIVLITHFMEEALLADRAIVMNKGEIALQGTPQHIFEHGDLLESLNLSLPRITTIGNRLTQNGYPVKNVLYPHEMANEIASRFRELNCSTYLAEDTNVQNDEKHGEWDIDIQNLTFTYSKRSPFATKALKGIDLHIGEGEFFGIIGHTGSGKSTLVQHLNALIKLPQAEKKYKAPKLKQGESAPVLPSIKIGRFDLGDKNCPWQELRANVGIVFQYPEYQLFAETVALDVAFGLKNFRPDLSKEEIDEAVKNAITMVGLDYEQVKEKSPFDLSGGQKRRVAIAGVIVTRPQILILDEPAAGLDPLGKKEIMELLHKLHRECCKTVIIVSHDMDEIADNCTRSAVLSEGEVKLCDQPSLLFRKEEVLKSLSLDIPLTAKICSSLQHQNYTIYCDYTCDDFAQKTIHALNSVKGGDNA